LNAAGRASYNKANPGKPGLKAPQPEGGSRKDSFCARMEGMKKKLTSAKTAKDPDRPHQQKPTGLELLTWQLNLNLL
jgi:hypothetical protein